MMIHQGLGRDLSEVNRSPALLRFGINEDKAFPRLALDGPANAQRLRRGIEIVPRQPERLADTKTGCPEYHPQRMQWRVMRPFKEIASLFRSQPAVGLGLDTRWFRPVDRVSRDDLTSHGIIQGDVQDSSRVPNGGRRESVLEHPSIPLLDVGRF